MKKAFLGLFMGLAAVVLFVIFGVFVLYQRHGSFLEQEVVSTWSSEDQFSPVSFSRFVAGEASVTQGFAPDMHLGIDVRASGDAPALLSLVDGKVTVAGWCDASWCDGMGNAVVVERADGSQVLYAHLVSVDVAVGDVVSAGQVLGVMGQTGRATGVIVHVEVCKTSCENRDPDNFTDPIDVLK